MSPQPCRCGHQAEAHRHYRYGTNCSACGCRVYCPAGWLTRILAGLRGAV